MSKVKFSSASVAGQVSPWCGQAPASPRKGGSKSIASPQAIWPGQPVQQTRIGDTKAKK